jgi:anaerobic selenocysteine-containing dehydrogenase
MPPTIHALLAARIERLRPEERTVLERAAVVGRQFSRSAVAALHPVSAAKLGLGNGDQLSVELNGAAFSFRLVLDASISTGVVLIPRSMGLAISAPAPVKLRAAEKA